MRRPVLIATLVVLTLVLVSPVAAQGPSPEADATAKIAPQLRQAAAKGGPVEFILTLAEQADLSGAATLPNRAAKARHVYERLTATARRSQPPVLAEVAAAGGQARPFALTNALLVKGDARLVDQLARRGDVKRLDPNPTVKAVEPAPTRPADKTAAGPGTPWGIEKVKAPTVWNQYTRGAGIVVGIADTGVEWDHEALKPHYRGWDGAAADHSLSWHDAIINLPTPLDDNGHGTHVTGTAVGGEGDNHIGVAPEARWIGCRNMENGVGTPARYLDCMEFMLAPFPPSGTFLADGQPELGADIISNSWGCTLDGRPTAPEGCLPNTLTQAVAALRAAGILFVASAGNDGPRCGTAWDPPAYLDETFAVGAFNQSGSIATFSGRGPATADGSNRPKPDLAAPGVDVQSAALGGGYRSLGGTSMASPHVAGIAALLWATVPALSGQPEATEALLRMTATPRNDATCGVVIPDRANNTWGWGEVEAFAATQAALMLSQVVGTVRDSVTGLPLASAQVALTGPGAFSLTVITDTEGHYSASLPAGPYGVMVNALGYLATGATVDAPPSGTGTADMALTPAARHAVGGTVRQADGQRPARATVEVVGMSLKAATDAGGVFTLSLPDGTYQVRAQAMGYRPTTANMTVSGGATVDLSLSLAPNILLVDDDEGRSLEQAWLTALGSLGHQADVYEVRQSGSGPTADEMDNYCLVIWVVGERRHRLREVDAQRLATYLERGGRLLLSEPGSAASSFHETYLRSLPGAATTMLTLVGVGPFSGQSYDYFVHDRADPAGGALPAEGGQPILSWAGQSAYGGIAHVGAYRSVYLTFALQNLATHRQPILVRQALDLLGCPACRLAGDVNYDGRVDVADIALVTAGRGQTAAATGYQRRLDRTLDGVVDGIDAQVVAAGWGGRCRS